MKPRHAAALALVGWYLPKDIFPAGRHPVATGPTFTQGERRPRAHAIPTHVFALLLLALSLTQTAASAQTSQEPSLPDPAVIAAPAGESGYYVFGTGAGIWFSTDLLNWTYEGQVFDQLPQWAQQAVPGANTYWAPDISFHNGLYYLYYAVSTFGSQQSAIGLATNATIDPTAPDYKWQDQGAVIETIPGQQNFNAIDPALFVDNKGRWNLFFGSFWTGIKVTRINPRTGRRKSGSPIKPVAARGAAIHPDSIEGAYVIRHGNFYYLFVSWNFCCIGARSTYEVAVGRSKSATGPYLDKDGTRMLKGGGTIVVKGGSRWIGPGHNSVLTTADGQYLFCAGYDANNLAAERVLQVRPMFWTNDGWPVVGDPLAQP